MCELFALSSRHPTTVELSLEEFSRHGGLSGPHKDGWGIAWYEDRDVRLVKETYPASESACVGFVQQHPPQSSFVISHIRKATRGGVATRNCQPFMRELAGCWHCFAHNGDLDAIGEDGRFAALTYQPVGETDSEQAFCAPLERLRPLWRDSVPPSLQARLDVVASFAADLRSLGPANFLYCDSDALFAHADRRRQSDGAIRSPALCLAGMLRLPVCDQAGACDSTLSTRRTSPASTSAQAASATQIMICAIQCSGGNSAASPNRALATAYMPSGNTRLHIVGS
jgi:predicted glutamine amidotransferase